MRTLWATLRRRLAAGDCVERSKMADAKKTGKNRKIGRHSRAASNKLQPQRTERNRRLRAERVKQEVLGKKVHLARRAADPTIQRRLAANARARTLRRLAKAEAALAANPSGSELAQKVASLRANLMV